MRDEGKQTLDRALDDLPRETPDRLCRAIRWLRLKRWWRTRHSHARS